MTVETVAPETLDPMDAAMDAKPLPPATTFFGEVVTVDAWFCVLQKGVGKAQFDALQHRADQRRTAIDIAIAPLQGSYTVEQKTIDTGKEWLKITLPSLREHGVPLAALKGRYCQVRREPTGETYTNKHDEVKDKTGLKFVAFYDDRAACEAAADAFWEARKAGAHTEEIDLPPITPLDELRDLWAASERNARVFRGLLKTNPLGEVYKWSSPEVKALIAESEDIPF